MKQMFAFMIVLGLACFTSSSNAEASHRHKNSCCEPVSCCASAPACCTPAPACCTPAPAPACCTPAPACCAPAPAPACCEPTCCKKTRCRRVRVPRERCCTTPKKESCCPYTALLEYFSSLAFGPRSNAAGTIFRLRNSAAVFPPHMTNHVRVFL